MWGFLSVVNGGHASMKKAFDYVTVSDYQLESACKDAPCIALVGNVVGHINEVNQRRARLVLGWVTVFKTGKPPQWRSQEGRGAGGPGPPMAGQKNKIDVRDFEVSRGLSSPKSPDITTRLRLSTFEHHLLLLPVADLEGRAGSAPPWATDRRRHCTPDK